MNNNIEPTSVRSNYKKFKRKAEYERFHFYLPGNNVIVVFRITGDLKLDALRRTIERMRYRHPMIRSHIEFDETDSPWFVDHETPPSPLNVVPRIDENTWLIEVLKEYWKPFDICLGPLIRFFFIQGSNESELIAFAQHSICDGLSLIYLLRDMLLDISHPREINRTIENLPTIKEGYNLDSIKSNPLIAKIYNKINKLWQTKQVKLTQADFYPLYKVIQTFKINAIQWTLDEATTLSLIKKSRAEGVSMNSVLYCAILNMQHLLQNDKEYFRKKITMPINLRKYLNIPIGEEVGLFVGGEKFEIKINWKHDFWKQVKAVHKKLQKRITPQSMFSLVKLMNQLDPTLMDARNMAHVGNLSTPPLDKYIQILKIFEHNRFLKKMKKKILKNQIQIGTILTNLGNISIPEDYDQIHLKQIIFLPPSIPYVEKFIGTVTFKNRLQGTIIFMEKFLNPEIATQFGHDLEVYLQHTIQLDENISSNRDIVPNT